MLRRSQVLIILGLASLASVFLARPQAYLSVLTDGSGILESTARNCTDNDGPGHFSPNVIDRTNWFQDKLWKDRCLEVEHVCFSAGRWWYNSPENISMQGRQKPPHQPNFTIKVHTDRQTSLPSEIVVSPSTSAVQNLTCRYSPLPNHLVLYSLYNDMLGEFVIRLLVGLTYILQHPEQSHKDSLDGFLSSTQIYLHLYNIKAALLDSHHAFTAPFLSRPLLNLRELLQSTSCSCVERLILCGYEFPPPNKENTGSSSIVVQPGPGFPPDAYRGPGADKNDPAVFRAAHAFIRQRAIEENPLVQIDIAEFRRQFLMSQKITEEDGVSYDEWTIVGLAQRSGRRKWLNLPDAKRMCDSLRSERIICIEVNVEKPAFTPLHHVVVHGSLDALIGIHGAQMTEAFWMKPGSLVVEILPFLPRGVTYGSWTRSVHGPTPVGFLFKGTDLYHVGLPLDWRSVSRCAALRGPDYVTCVRRQKWDSRDFDVQTDDVREVILQFAGPRRPSDCSAQQQGAGSDRFVLYNAQCDDGNGQGVENHFFYWSKRIEEIDAFSSYPEPVVATSAPTMTALVNDSSTVP